MSKRGDEPASSMTIHEEFVKAAMQGVLAANPKVTSGMNAGTFVARAAIAAADATLAELEKEVADAK